MFGRRSWLFAVLVAAVAVPFFLSGDATWQPVSQWWNSMWTDAAGGPQPLGNELPTHNSGYANYPLATASPAVPTRLAPSTTVPGYSPNATPYQPPFHSAPFVPPYSIPTAVGSAAPQGPLSQPVAGFPNAQAPMRSFGTLFRFDITPAWVMNNWARVSTRVMDLDLEGFRVSVVSGTSSHDLCGSLTYYFDRQRTLQRILFQGVTGDPAQLVDYMMQNHGMQSEPILDAGLYVAKEGETIGSALRVRHAPVIRASNPYQRFQVVLELNRPGSGRGLSQVLQSVLRSDQRSRTWRSETDRNAERNVQG